MMNSSRPAPRTTMPDAHVGVHHALGIDVGGTKVAAGIVDLRTGTITGRRQIPTAYKRGGLPVLADVTRLTRDLMDEASGKHVPLKGLGIGVAELVSPEGTVFSDYRIAWKGLNVQRELSALLPSRVESDVRAAALAEARYGAGRSYRDFIYVTIGTGISAVSVRDGVPYAGSRGAALVIANGATRHTCPSCGHVATQVLEDIASGPGLVAAWGGAGRAEEVLAAADAGDASAIAVIRHAAGELGNVLALLVNSLDPAAVIVGGGLGSAPGRYWEELNTAIIAGIWDQDARALPIIQASLGPDAGIIGAAAGLDPAQEQEPEQRTHRSN